MPQRIYNNEWRRENADTAYPFSETVSLKSQDGRVILHGTFIDAVISPVGGQAGLCITKVTVTNELVTITIGDIVNRNRCTGSFGVINPPDSVELQDEYGRPAGLLVSEALRLASLQSWGLGEHVISPGNAEFVAAVCCPTPEVGLRGFILPDGTVVSGEVWLVGDAGVVLRVENDTGPVRCQPEVDGVVIRVDVVGDPLFRRRLCAGAVDYRVPRFIQAVRILYPGGQFTVTPDDAGDLSLTPFNSLAADTALRVRPKQNGMIMEMAGAPV
jgi:hypothetical protein